MRQLLRPTFVALLALAAPLTSAVEGQTRQGSAPHTLPSFDPMEQSIEALQQALQAKQVTSRQLVEIFLARIREYDQRGPALNALKALNPKVLEAADALDAERATRGPRGPLHGIPVLVKDNYETIEMPTTAGSIALATFHPRRDAFQVARLKAAGAIILGKTNMHELAAGVTSIGTSFGQVRNPYDPGRNPGGSSGGTGSAVAANFAVAGMGSDTCGSIRNPASQNNLVGLRGTRGLSSRTGIVPLSSTQDIGGPIARGIADLAILLDATVGRDPADTSTTASEGRIPVSYRAALRAEALKGTRIGVVRSLFGTAAEDQEVATLVDKTLDTLKKAGAEIVDVPIPGLDDLLRDTSMIHHDFKFDLEEYLAQTPDAPVKDLGDILDRGLVHTALEANFRLRNTAESRDTEPARRARVKRVALRQAIESVLDEHRLTAVVYPTLRRKPSRLLEPQGGSNCQLSAASGLPALGLPAGFTDDGLPVGMDLLGGAFREEALLSLGYGIEQTLMLRRPPFSTPALVNGARPAPRTTSVALRPSGPGGTTAPSTAGTDVVLDVTYDESAGRMDYAFRIPPALENRVEGIWLHAGTGEKPGAARHQLFGPTHATSGSIAVGTADRTDLAAGGLLVRIYLRDVAGSAADAPLTFK